MTMSGRRCPGLIHCSLYVSGRACRALAPAARTARYGASDREKKRSRSGRGSVRNGGRRAAPSQESRGDKIRDHSSTAFAGNAKRRGCNNDAENAIRSPRGEQGRA